MFLIDCCLKQVTFKYYKWNIFFTPNGRFIRYQSVYQLKPPIDWQSKYNLSVDGKASEALTRQQMSLPLKKYFCFTGTLNSSCLTPVTLKASMPATGNEFWISKPPPPFKFRLYFKDCIIYFIINYITCLFLNSYIYGRIPILPYV